MKIREANNIIANARASMSVDGVKVPAACDVEGARLLTSGFGYDGYVHSLAGTPFYAAGTVFTRLIELCADGQPAVFDAELLSAIHKKLYGGLQSNAGQFRRTNMQLYGASFTDYRYIAGSLKRLLNKMGCKCSAKTEFCSLLTHYYAELYLLAPFEQGNGVTIRTFLWLFARSKGFTLDYFKVPTRTVAEAERLAFTTDNVTELYNCLFTAVTYFNNKFDLPETRGKVMPRPTARTVKKTVRRPEPTVVRPVVKKAPPVAPKAPPKEQTKETPKAPPKETKEQTAEPVSDVLLEAIKRQLKAELMEELKAQLAAETAAQEEAKVKTVTLDPPAAPIPPAPATVAPVETVTDTVAAVGEAAAAEDVPVAPDPVDPPIERNTSVTIDPPIERNTKPSRATVKRRERADKLKQKIAKLRQNLESLLDDNEE